VAPVVYDWLLFLHVLAAFLLVGTVVVYSAVALGATAPARTASVANTFWAVGGLGTIILGIALAIDVDGYEVWDGWILLAIALWAGATELGRRAQLAFDDPAAGKLAQWHWLRTVLVLALLVVMVWKPGA
jgi:hypothetical protein